MRRNRPMLVVLLALGAHLGCYQSAFPLDGTPTAPLDAALLRRWRCTPASGSGVVTITVKRASPTLYAITLAAPGEAPEEYEAYATPIAGQVVLNVKDKDPRATRPWSFARYERRDETLTISLLSEQGLPANLTTPQALEQALAGPAATYATLCACKPK